jgi:hypothetical protein
MQEKTPMIDHMTVEQKANTVKAINEVIKAPRDANLTLNMSTFFWKDLIDIAGLMGSQLIERLINAGKEVEKCTLLIEEWTRLHQDKNLSDHELQSLLVVALAVTERFNRFYIDEFFNGTVKRSVDMLIACDDDKMKAFGLQAKNNLSQPLYKE